MKRLFLIIISTFLLLFSCQKSIHIQQFDKDELQISILTAGGWCSGSDSLTLGKNKSVYVYRTTCKSDAQTINNNVSLNDWNELTNLLDTDKFKSVNLNECGVCYDGSDETVSIKYGNYYHSIRYDKINDTQLNIIRPFIEKLRAIRDKYKVQYQK